VAAPLLAAADLVGQRAGLGLVAGLLRLFMQAAGMGTP